MLGAIIGDIVGSVYEWNNIHTKEFPLFHERSFFTDDSVMTIAVADALMKWESEGHGGAATLEDALIDSMKEIGRRYPHSGYGGRFNWWLFSDSREPYNSFGNGSAMRVAPAGWLMDCDYMARTGEWPEDGLNVAKTTAAVTHNHPEGIKGAAVTADAIFIGRLFRGGYLNANGEPVVPGGLEGCKKMIRGRAEQVYGYDLSATLDEIRPHYRFNESCQGTVPQAITAFLESTDFEDAIRNAISLGGDSDTLACITGGIAEAVYGIPEPIAQEAMRRLDLPLRQVVGRWDQFIALRGQ